MQSKLIRKYFKCGSNYQSVEEGWGVALGYLAGILLAPIGIAIPLYQGHLTRETATRLLSNPKLKKYVISECDKIYKDAKRKYHKITKDVHPGMFESAEDRTKDKSTWGHKSISFKHHFITDFKIGPYTCGLIGDTDHIDGIMVFFRDQETDRLFQINVPAPTRKDIHEMGFEQRV